MVSMAASLAPTPCWAPPIWSLAARH